MSALTVYVDVSDLLRTGATTGIQRVVSQIVPRLAARADDQILIRMLRFDPGTHVYEELDTPSMFDNLADPERMPVVAGQRAIGAFQPGDVFFDLDSAWNSPLKRSTLYPALKEAGVTIVSYVYDLVPLQVPSAVQASTIANWIVYFSSVLAYSDLVMTDSRSAERDLLDWADRLGVGRHIPTLVTRLGNELPKVATATAEERQALRPLRRGRYLLFVGTIEPRKRQQLALEAFDLLRRRHPDLHLVFAGRRGWMADQAVDAIVGHPLYGSRVHWIDSPSDALLVELYKAATACLYLSHYEGYGLPIAEALGHGRVTIATRGSSMYEVGKEACDYTYFDTAPEIAETLAQYLGDAGLLRERERHIRDTFRPIGWETVARTIGTALCGLERAAELQRRPRPTKLQLVFISNNPEKVERAIGLYDERAPFVREYVVIAPGHQLESISAIESSHRVVVVDESRILRGREQEFRAADHQKKNWMLRAGLAWLDEVDDVFVMLDDDNLPLVEIGVDDFISEEGRFNAFHFYDLIRWGHRVSEFDDGQATTAAVLDPGGFELLSYASHQPQVIDKTLFGEAVEWADREASALNICEWATYFNHSVTRYPTLFRKRPFRTLNWPGRASDWTHQYPPTVYRFENFYSKSYSIGLFMGLAASDEAERKLLRKRTETAPYLRSQRLFEASRPLIMRDGLAHGTVRFAAKGLQILVSGLPQLITTAAHSTLRLDVAFQVRDLKSEPHEIELCYQVLNHHDRGVRVRGADWPPVPYDNGLASLPIVAQAPGSYEVEYFVRVDGEAVYARGVRYLAKLVVLGANQKPERAYRALESGAPPDGVRPTASLRRFAKQAALRAMPSLGVERERLHTMERRTQRVERAVRPLRNLVRDSELRQVRLEEGLALVRDQLEQATSVAAPSLRVVAERIAASGVTAPVYGLTGLDTESPREIVARLRVIEDHLGRVVGKRLLVIGSGFGFVPMYFAERGAKVTGWEPNALSSDVARAVADAVGSPATFGSPGDMLARISAIDPAHFDFAIVDPTLDPAAEDTGRWVEALCTRVPVVIYDGVPEQRASAEPGWSVLGTFPWHAEQARRPLIVRRRPQTVTVDGREYAYERSTAEAYEGSPMARHSRFRRYYFSPNHVIKEYHYEALSEQELRQPLREINLHVNTLAEAGVWHCPPLLAFELLPGEVRLVYQTVPGQLLRDAAPFEKDTATDIARDLLRTLDDLGDLGLFHNDTRSWNVIVGEQGAWLIDYGLAGPVPSEDNALALLWTLHTALTGTAEGFAVDKADLPDRAAFAGTALENLFDLVTAGERGWSALRESIAPDPGSSGGEGVVATDVEDQPGLGTDQHVE